MNKLYCNQTGGHELPVTAPFMLKNIPSIKEIKGLIKVDIINLNLKQSINLLEKLPNMENGVVIFILAVRIGAAIVSAQKF